MSQYPSSVDVFPGYPYVDFTEYVLAAYANSWAQAFLAIESTIGAGTGNVATNPLYSTAYGASYATIAARLTNVETTAVNAVKIDTAVGDIKPVAAAANAGSTLKAANSDHVHVGVSAFNTRSGTVTLTTADLFSLFTAAGQLATGTGTGTGTLLGVGSANQVLGVVAPGQLGWITNPSGASGDLKFTSAFNYDATNWLQANNQAVSRTTYANLFTASTLTWSGTGSGSQISGLTTQQTALLMTGMLVEGPSLGNGVTITAVGSTTVNVSGAPGVGTFRVLPFGQGDGSTTFNVVDMSGRTPVGAGAGSSLTARFLGQKFGEENHQLSVAELAAHAHALTDNGHVHGVSDAGHVHGIEDAGHTHPPSVANGAIMNFITGGNVGGGSAPSNIMQGYGATGVGGTGISIQNHFTGVGVLGNTTGISVNSQGSSTPHNTVQPSMAGFWLVHV